MVLAFILAGCDRTESKLTADQHAIKGRQFYSVGKIDDAIESYKKALMLKPENGTLHYELGVIYFEEWRKSRDIAQRKLLADVMRRPDEEFTTDEKLLIQYGYKKEFHRLALSEFSETLKYEPSNWAARYYIATDLFNNQKYDQTIIEFNEIIRLKPDFANNYTFLGKAYLMIGQYQLAIDTLEKAVNIEPNAYNYYSLGLAYRKINNGKKVSEIMRKLKDMNSSYYDELRLGIFEEEFGGETKKQKRGRIGE